MSVKAFRPLLVLVALLGILGFFVSTRVPIAHAAGIVVTNALDETTGSNGCSLREAITNANDNAATFGDCAAGSGPDTITFNIPDTGAECLSNNICTITLGSSLPGISDDLTIDGAPNNGNITVSGAYLYRVMMVNSGKTLGLNALTIANGYVFSGVAGGIWNYGTLNVTNSAFNTNYASSGGGGIFNEGGTVNIIGSTFSGNNAGSGGAIYNLGGTYNIANSTFSGNFANNGGAVFNFDTTANITNSTFSGNYANTGGVVYNLSGTLNLKNSILANTSNGGDCFNGATITGSDNLIDDTTCGSSSPFRLGAVTDFDTTLANNGGPTQTFKLNADSNAINAVPAGQCTFVSSGTNPLFSDGAAITTDQRGETRPQGLFCDVGAYEFVYTGFQTGPNFLVNSAADTNDNSCDTLGQGIGNKDCTLREAINAANALAGADTITFEIPDDVGALCSADNTCTITLSALGTLPAINDDVTINGAPNAGKITVSGASMYRVLIVNNGKALNLNALMIANGNCSGCDGGGISNFGTLNVTNSTFRNNTGNSGGAILNVGNLTLTNSTLYGNMAGFGGAIFTLGTATLTNSTLADNIGTIQTGGIENDTGTLHLRNTIIANSTGDNCHNNGGIVSTNVNNLIEPNNSCGAPLLTADPNLGALADNGGPTQTMALSNFSIAIDAGDASVCDDNPGPNNLDQRGNARNDLQCDIGAFEFVETDGDTISKAWTTNGTNFTFGPTLADMLLNSGSPLTLVVKREPGAIPPGTPPASALPILWDATTKESPFSLMVTLCYDPTGLTPPYENSLHVWHYNGATWDDLGGTLDTVTHAPYHCVTATTALTSLSPLLLAPIGTTAVNVTGVKAVVNKKGNVIVKWRTTDESQIAGFNVYRKTAKGEWTQVNTKFKQARSAGSTEANKYRFADKKVTQGKTYRYKIEVIYLDNHSEWTKIVKVKTP